MKQDSDDWKEEMQNINLKAVTLEEQIQTRDAQILNLSKQMEIIFEEKREGEQKLMKSIEEK